MTAAMTEAGGDVAARFYLTPAVPVERMIANMRSALARGLPEVTPCRSHGLTLSVAGGGPSLADTWPDLDGFVCAVNGSLRFLLEREIRPSASYACGVMDAGEHIADMIVADPKVRYYVASVCDPAVFDKLAGCDVRVWHVSPRSTQDPEGVVAVLNEAHPGKDWIAIGGGCTMGLRWINLGYTLGFRKFKLHGLDSSFREGSTHAYPDRADAKDHIIFDGWETRPNFLAQVHDFFGTLNLFRHGGFDPIEIEVFGTGLLQDRWHEWLATQQRSTGEWSDLPEMSDRPLVCCVKTGSKYGPEYVTRLRDGVARHLAVPHDFVCFTDAPIAGVRCVRLPADLPGWWAKVGLFKLRRPLLYFDLDVVVTGDLSPLHGWDGFGIIKDWWQSGFNSSVMKITGGEADVWDRFTPDVMERLPGDQDWITEAMPQGRTFPPDLFPSFKADRCQSGVPDGALAVIFHGLPKPHQCGGWVAEHWIEEKEKT